MQFCRSLGETSTYVSGSRRAATPYTTLSDLGESKTSADYFLPDFFAAQYAFNLADNLALAAGLIAFFFAFAAGWAERADFARRSFSHLAF